MSHHQIIVLGWDGLDHSLVEKWDLNNHFGPYTKELATIRNPVLGTPHTREIWPTIISGQNPGSHGIRAVSDSDRVEWQNEKINLASKVGQYIVPKSIRIKVGRYLMQNVSKVNEYGPKYYENNDIETVFDKRLGKTVSIPNYRVELDDKYGFSFYRKPFWSEILETESTEDGRSLKRPLVELQDLEEQLNIELMKRVGIVTSALEWNYEIIFCWFGYLDTIGHIDPVVSELSFQKRHYKVAANVTRFIKSMMASKDVLICISDHGLRNGYHTDSAVVSSTEENIINQISSVVDFKSVLDEYYPPSGINTIERKNAIDTTGNLKTAMSKNEIRQRLDDLGYL